MHFSFGLHVNNHFMFIWIERDGPCFCVPVYMCVCVCLRADQFGLSSLRVFPWIGSPFQNSLWIALQMLIKRQAMLATKALDQMHWNGQFIDSMDQLQCAKCIPFSCIIDLVQKKKVQIFSKKKHLIFARIPKN